MIKFHARTVKSTSRRLLVAVVLSAGFFALSCRPSTASQEQTSASSGDSTSLRSDTLQLVFAGDIMTHGPQIRAAAQANGDYDFTSSFEAVRPLIAQADLAVGNLETTFGGSPYSGYPMFSSPEALAVALRYSGFDVLTTANNHSCDRRAYGITHTIDVLDSLGIATTGSYRTQEERSKRTPLICSVRGVKLAIFAYTYGTNGLPIPHPTVIDTIDKERISSDLHRADSLGAEYKIVQIHWGNEYEQNPNKVQRELAQWLADQGVDAIIGSHPHVIQESARLQRQGERTHGTFVIYSMGNFISNQITPIATRGGMLLSLTLTRKSKSAAWKTQPHYQYVFVEKHAPNGRSVYRLHPVGLSDTLLKGISPHESSELRAFQRYYRKISLAE